MLYVSYILRGREVVAINHLDDEQAARERGFFTLPGVCLWPGRGKSSVQAAGYDAFDDLERARDLLQQRLATRGARCVVWAEIVEGE